MDDRKVMISEAARLVDVESHVLRYWEDELHIPVKRTAQGHRYYTKEDLQLFHCIKRLKDETVSIKELKQIVPELLKAQELQHKAKEQVPSHVPDSSSTTDSTNKATTPSTSTASDEQPGVKTSSALTDPSDQPDVKTASASSSNFTGTSAESGHPNTASSGTGIQTKKGTSPEISGTDANALTPSSHTEVIEDLPLKQARELIGAVLNEVVTDNNKVLTRELRQTLTADIMQEMDFLVQAKERKEEDHFRKLDQLIRQQQSIRRETVGHANPLLRLKRLLT